MQTLVNALLEINAMIIRAEQQHQSTDALLIVRRIIVGRMQS